MVGETHHLLLLPEMNRGGLGPPLREEPPSHGVGRVLGLLAESQTWAWVDGRT